MLPIHTILVPTDFSIPSADALAVAAALARDRRARLVLLHVMEEPASLEGTGVIPFDPEMYRDELLEKLDQQAVRCPGVRLDTRLAQGKTVAQILRAAQEYRCDLIVMGSHGWSRLRRLLLGSVAEDVSGKAPCPVLVVRAPLPQDVPPFEPAQAAK
jgi:nucleotide-binding universal stress UspA family protein